MPWVNLPGLTISIAVSLTVARLDNSSSPSFIFILFRRAWIDSELTPGPSLKITSTFDSPFGMHLRKKIRMISVSSGCTETSLWSHKVINLGYFTRALNWDSYHEMIVYNITTISKGNLQITASYKVVAFRIISGRRIVETMTPPLSRLPWRLRIKLQTVEGSGEQGVAQCWERSPPASAARVQIPASTPYFGWVCCWFSTLLERFFSRDSGFPLSSETNISKFQFDQESGRRRTTLWMCYLQIIIYFIYLLFEWLTLIQLQPTSTALL